jgi:hypothetical protein
MTDDTLRNRLLDRVMGPPDPEPDPELDAALAADPELLAEYRRLEAAWERLAGLPVHDPPAGAREAARAGLLEAMAEAAFGAADEGSSDAEAQRASAEKVPGRRTRARPGGPLRPAWAVHVAAALVFFMAGVGVGLWSAPAAPALPSPASPELTDGDDRPRFALLIRAPERPDGVTAMVPDLTGWAAELWADERLVWADRTFYEAGERVGAADACPGRDPVGVLFMIRAADRAEAVRLAAEAPYLDEGLSVEVLPTSEESR